MFLIFEIFGAKVFETLYEPALSCLGDSQKPLLLGEAPFTSRFGIFLLNKLKYGIGHLVFRFWSPLH